MQFLLPSLWRRVQSGSSSANSLQLSRVEYRFGNCWRRHDMRAIFNAFTTTDGRLSGAWSSACIDCI